MNDEIRRLRTKGFLLRDNLFPDSVFRRHKLRIQKSWKNGDGWATGVKAGNEAGIFARQSQKSLEQIDKLVRSQAEGFQYIYHSLHESRDERVDNPQYIG